VINGSTVNQVKVSLGSKIGPNIIVKEGLDDGKTIVTDGVQKLHNGSAVQFEMNKPAGNATTYK